MSFAIGSFTFLDLQFPDYRKKQTAVEVRAGQDNHTTWITGTRGVPMQVVSWRDCVNFADAATAYNNYTTIIGTQQIVTWAGIVLPTYYDVLDVAVGDNILRTVLGVGGVLGLSQGLVIATWTLIPTGIAVTPGP
jgi:hypothetical protein